MHEVLLHECDKSQDVARECIRTPDSFEPAEHVRVELRKDLSHDQPFLDAVEQEPLADGLLVQVDEGMRFTGARPGEHAQWSVDFVDVEWQMVPLSGAGDLIMRGPGSSSQPCLLRVARPRRPWPASGPTRSTAIGSSSDRCRWGTGKGS